MREALEIVVTETPNGDYQASCGGLTAEAPTPAEAEEILRELLQDKWAANPTGHQPAILADPNFVPDIDEE